MPPIQTDNHFTFFTALTVLTLLLGVFAFSVFRHLRTKQRQMKSRTFKDMNAMEADRRRIASDLHDDFGSVIHTAKLNLENLHKAYPENQTVDQTVEILNGSLLRLREISLNLLPPELEIHGLHYAIGVLVERINHSNRIRVDYTGSINDAQYDTEKELILYRIIQELLTNAIKHSEASRIELALVEQGNKLLFEMRDNGRGFEYERALTKKGSSGLKNIQARLHVLNATIVTDSLERRGTQCFITIPIKQLHINGAS